MKKHMVIQREDHSRHKGHGTMTRYFLSKEEIEEKYGKVQRNEKEYRQRNLTRFLYGKREPMRETSIR